MHRQPTPPRPRSRRTLKRLGALLSFLFVLFVAGLSLLPYLSRANSNTEIIITPAADSYTNKNQAGQNFGSSSRFYVQGGPSQLSYLRFEVSGLDQKVAAANLRLYVTHGSANAGVKIYSTSGAWDEQSITWQNQPALGPQVGELAPGTIARQSWVTIPLGNAITGDGTYNIVLASDSPVALGFRSRDRSKEPQLVLTTSQESPQPFPTPIVGPEQDTLLLNPAADSYTDKSQAGRNYGTSSRIHVQGGPSQLTYMRFNVSGIGQSSVTAANLRLFVSYGDANAGLKLYSTTGEWDEQSITWQNQPALGPQVGELAATAIDPQTWVTIPLGQAIPGDGTYSFVLTTDSPTSLAFRSRDRSKVPELVLTLNQPGEPPVPTATASPETPPAPTSVPPTSVPTVIPPSSTPTVAPPSPTSPPTSDGTVYYVSKQGNNGDGRAWASAWSELEKINWGVVRGGDTIMVDGGAQQMTYNTALIVGTSGSNGKPITIRLSHEAGRNGQAIFHGGRSKPQPACGSADSADMTGIPKNGIEIQDKSQLVIDGTKWRGIVVTGFGKNGVLLRNATDIQLRYVELTNNGTPNKSQGMQLINSRSVTLENALVHDNGVDGIQGSYTDHLTIRRSWVYNTQARPYDKCEHADGLQIFGDGMGQNGDVHAITIEESVFGPNLVQALLLGENNDPKLEDSWAVVRDVILRDTLFYDFDNSGVHSHHHPYSMKPKNWLLERVTSFRDPKRPATGYHNVYLEGSNHTVRDSIFYGQQMTVGGGSFSNNCQWSTSGVTVGKTADPQFSNAFSSNALEKNFALPGNSPCAGMGSRITSASQLLAMP